MSNPLPPTIDPVAARRWLQQMQAESPWLHEEVARRMEPRLQWITKQPGTWLHWSPMQGGLQAHSLIARRYPLAQSYVTQPHPVQLQAARKQLQPRWWSRLRSGASAPRFGLPESPVGMLWANMALHADPDPLALIQQWHHLLEVDGFLMFSCLGPDTLRELRGLYARQGWAAPGHDFTDMHDWGDMLVRSGFADPIVDMERITLTYSSPHSLLKDLRTLGRNFHPQRFSALRGRKWLTQLHRGMEQELASTEQTDRLQLTFEIIYGHAFKPQPRVKVQAQSSISLEDMRRSLGVGTSAAARGGRSGE